MNKVVELRHILQRMKSYGIIPSIYRTGYYFLPDGVKKNILKRYGFVRCDSDCDLQLVYVDPSEIDELNLFCNEMNALGMVGKGKGIWDKYNTNIKFNYKYTSLKRVLIEGVSWEKTQYYQQTHEIKGRKIADEKIKRYKKMYEEIASEGYKTQLQLYNSNGGDKSQYQRGLGDVYTPSELRIAIDRNGNIVRTADGFHRLIILKLLDYSDPIPAIVQFKHNDSPCISEIFKTTKPLNNHDLYSPG